MTEAPFALEMRNITKTFPGVIANDDEACVSRVDT